MLLQVAAFYLITFGLTIILGMIQQTIGAVPQMIVLPQLAPGLTALLMLLLFPKHRLKLTITLKTAQFRKYLAALLLPLGVMVLVFLVYGFLIDNRVMLRVTPAPSLLLLGGMLIGAFGEELGWRGYLQKSLDRRIMVVLSSTLVGLLWAFWHIDLYQNGPYYMFFFALSLIAYSISIAWLLRGSRYNVVIATLFHFTINFSTYIFFLRAANDPDYMRANAIIWIAVAGFIVLSQRKFFFRQQSS
jgi:membrane protease YdiL (CAAX protease family)